MSPADRVLHEVARQIDDLEFVVNDFMCTKTCPCADPEVSFFDDDGKNMTRGDPSLQYAKLPEAYLNQFGRTMNDSNTNGTLTPLLFIKDFKNRTAFSTFEQCLGYWLGQS